MDMYKKIITPILYAACFVPVFIVTICILVTLEQTIGRLSNIFRVGVLEALLSLLVIGSILFWWANRLISRGEKLVKPNKIDHLRQSSCYYFILFSILGYFIQNGIHGGLGEGYLLFALAISLWAIIINAVFLYTQNKANNPT